MIKKLIIVALLAGLAYGAFRLMDESDFFGAKGKQRKRSKTSRNKRSNK